MKLLSNLKYACKAKSPQIKFGVSIALGIATVVSACIATHKSEPVIEDLKNDEEEAKENREDSVNSLSDLSMTEEERKNQIAVIDKQYSSDIRKAAFRTVKKIVFIWSIPTVLGIMTFKLNRGGFKELNKRYITAAGAASTFQEILKKYRGRVADAIGEDKEKDLYHGVKYEDVTVIDEKGKKKTIKKAPVYDVEPLGPCCVRFTEFDPNSRLGSTYFDKVRNDNNILFLKNAQRNANEDLRLKGYMTVDELLTHYMGMKAESLDIPERALTWGWRYTKDDSDNTSDNYIDFGIWDAYWRIKNPELMDVQSYGAKDIWVDLNAVPLLYVDEKKENKLPLLFHEDRKISLNKKQRIETENKQREYA